MYSTVWSRPGNTVLVIEHNLDMIRNADWVIDLGPEGGDRGGEIVAEGPPKVIAKSKRSYTGQVLRERGCSLLVGPSIENTAGSPLAGVRKRDAPYSSRRAPRRTRTMNLCSSDARSGGRP